MTLSFVAGGLACVGFSTVDNLTRLVAGEATADDLASDVHSGSSEALSSCSCTSSYSDNALVEPSAYSNSEVRLDMLGALDISESSNVDVADRVLDMVKMTGFGVCEFVALDRVIRPQYVLLGDSSGRLACVLREAICAECFLLDLTRFVSLDVSGELERWVDAAFTNDKIES